MYISVFACIYFHVRRNFCYIRDNITRRRLSYYTRRYANPASTIDLPCARLPFFERDVSSRSDKALSCHDPRRASEIVCVRSRGRVYARTHTQTRARTHKRARTYERRTHFGRSRYGRSTWNFANRKKPQKEGVTDFLSRSWLTNASLPLAHIFYPRKDERARRTFWTSDLWPTDLVRVRLPGS